MNDIQEAHARNRAEARSMVIWGLAFALVVLVLIAGWFR
jgi:hypothetical protein